MTGGETLVALAAAGWGVSILKYAFDNWMNEQTRWVVDLKDRRCVKFENANAPNKVAIAGCLSLGYRDAASGVFDDNDPSIIDVYAPGKHFVARVQVFDRKPSNVNHVDPEVY